MQIVNQKISFSFTINMFAQKILWKYIDDSILFQVIESGWIYIWALENVDLPFLEKSMTNDVFVIHPKNFKLEMQ